MISIVKRVEFSCAHILPFHQGKCRRLHGHNYIVEVAVSAVRLNKTNMVMDFSDLKSAISVITDQWDHHLLLASLEENTALEADARTNTLYLHIQGDHPRTYGGPIGDAVILPIQSTTAECLAQYLFTMIRSTLTVALGLDYVRVYETPTSYAEARQ